VTKTECALLYHCAEEGGQFYEMVLRFANRKNAEKLLSLCRGDFGIAFELGKLCHWNILFIEQHFSFPKRTPSSVISFLKPFASAPTHSPFVLLEKYDNALPCARLFLSRCQDDATVRPTLPLTVVLIWETQKN
jgi:hypothetical protein